ncbi:MAG: L-histidine N(alpha)-methyltransferase [Rhodocyclaceae bacterium]
MTAFTLASRSQAPAPAAPPHGLREAFASDVLSGLSRAQKQIAPTWLYDEIGCQLFEAITELPEYYPTRTEVGILQQCVTQIARTVGPDAIVVEIGSGSSRKTPLLLEALTTPQAYVPIDIADEFLSASIPWLAARFRQMHFFPTLGDFRLPLHLPVAVDDLQGPRLGFFPGSTIGNLRPFEAQRCLANIRATLGTGAFLVLGVDITLDHRVLLPAYDDARGITAQFNLNLLERINRELAGTFDLSAFRHQARFDARRPRIEMHLVSTAPQSASVLGQRFQFAAGETIHTENSYKYRLTEVAPMARSAGWQTENVWTDPQSRFAVFLLRALHR